MTNASHEELALLIQTEISNAILSLKNNLATVTSDLADEIVDRLSTKIESSTSSTESSLSDVKSDLISIIGDEHDTTKGKVDDQHEVTRASIVNSKEDVQQEIEEQSSSIKTNFNEKISLVDDSINSVDSSIALVDNSVSNLVPILDGIGEDTSELIFKLTNVSDELSTLSGDFGYLNAKLIDLPKLPGDIQEMFDVVYQTIASATSEIVAWDQTLGSMDVKVQSSLIELNTSLASAASTNFDIGSKIDQMQQVFDDVIKIVDVIHRNTTINDVSSLDKLEKASVVASNIAKTLGYVTPKPVEGVIY